MKRVLRKLKQRFENSAYAPYVLPYRHAGVTEEKWEEYFSTGYWDYLKEIGQRARYHVIGGYCEYFADAGRVLDVGCGEGVLWSYIRHGNYAGFLGIDGSHAAIGKAPADDRAAFEVADVFKFETTEKFDVIVFNEVLYYLKDPIDVLKKFAALLNDDGVIVNSMFNQRHWNRKLWWMVDETFEVVDAVNVGHVSGKGWTIKAFRPRG